ncbi:hypothetical protein SAMN02745121_02872 [Nannocystis exedens]|uniref:Lipoprotein n=1 Tax=Nannocystis exedens TaxID=54 RepID=A0A1I1XN77_9BACT|nr:hypothetical protein [Nannocystis exedens]PCC73399.1 hypothetical protein NAEX_06487 [Nannocystis exedens]SFE06920.1 hypothetical protein SAMN02745121_02872 [Nannocystis exedens]
MLRTTIASLALLLGTLTGCQTEPDIQARAAELADMPGVAVKIAGADLDHTQVHAIAKHLEAKAVDTGAAMVRMKKDDQGGSSLEIELYAKSLPPAEALTADLKTTFPALADATITTAPAAGQVGDLPAIEVSKELSPEEAKQEILDQLQADGVDGHVDVQIQDGADGRRIEVKIEKQEVH